MLIHGIVVITDIHVYNIIITDYLNHYRHVYIYKRWSQVLPLITASFRLTSYHRRLATLVHITAQLIFLKTKQIVLAFNSTSLSISQSGSQYTFIPTSSFINSSILKENVHETLPCLLHYKSHVVLLGFKCKLSGTYCWRQLLEDIM